MIVNWGINVGVRGMNGPNREKEKPTHFISIPLTVPHIRDRVSLFKSSVLDSCRRERGICEDVFQLPEKFHLTVGVLRIFSEEEEERGICEDVFQLPEKFHLTVGVLRIFSEEEEERGICEDVFQLPEKFHLTVGVLRIFSEEEEEKEKAVVKEAIAMAKLTRLRICCAHSPSSLCQQSCTGQ
ncbi:Activating signal cointegrator 1 complex subunit 1 [Geodia barretti]|uniref:Activating signal cointegrator 1 complex subunit 1 n=1 Tax=Geodia barretti TaxID=519541 RepID=A0AA35WDK9_GEOBA|nr:Activating signal cointegrator 1 complex subunit 1 [Geodia barretti]